MFGVEAVEPSDPWHPPFVQVARTVQTTLPKWKLAHASTHFKDNLVKLKAYVTAQEKPSTKLKIFESCDVRGHLIPACHTAVSSAKALERSD